MAYASPFVHVPMEFEKAIYSSGRCFSYRMLIILLYYRFKLPGFSSMENESSVLSTSALPPLMTMLDPSFDIDASACVSGATPWRVPFIMVLQALRHTVVS